MNEKTVIKLGQVWRATKDYKIPEQLSPQKGCVIPKDTRVVVLNNPITGRIGFQIMPLSSKGIDARLVPNLKQMEIKKEGFGVGINIEYFERYFILDDDQNIAFDNVDAKKFWETIRAYNLNPKDKS